MKKSREGASGSVGRCMKYLFIGCIAGLGLCAALLAACAFLFVVLQKVPSQAVQAVSIGIAAASAMFAGFLAARLCKSRGMVMGLLCGLVLFVCVLVSSICAGGGAFTVSAVLRFLLMLAGGAFGGVLAVNRRKKVK